MTTEDEPARSGGAGSRWLPPAWALALSLLMLGPALAPGYVLSYDMVWVPDLALRTDFLGLGSGLPRAVPSDAVVAVVDSVLPGMLLQKVVLLGCLAAGGVGAARLVPDLSVAARCVAVTVWVWNPFVVERLVLGHWPVLVGYAVLPWLVVAGRRTRAEGRLPGAVWLLLPLGSLSASAGLVSAVAFLAFAASAARRGTTVVAFGLVVAANAPWVVSGLLHSAEATSDGSGAAAFALNGEGLLAAPLAALGLGGIWNTEVVLPSRAGVLAVLGLALLVALALAGARSWARAFPARDRAAFGVCWVLGWGLAVLTWAATDQVAWLVTEVPGAGLLRDGSRMLGLCVPAVVTLAAHGGESLLRRVPDRRTAAAWSVALVLLPVTLLPDAALGASGRLAAVDFPASYASVRGLVGDADGHDVLLLPFTSYRAPDWNDGRKVLDPWGRYLRPNYVANDELVVSGRLLAGEDPRGAEVRAALAEDTPERRAEGLAGLGIGYVVVDRQAPGPAPEVAGTVVRDDADTAVLRVADPSPRAVPTGWWIAMVGAWAAYLALLLGPLAIAARGRLGRNAANRPTRW